MGTLLVIVAYYLFYLFNRHPKNFPPHPRFSIPVFGDSIFMGKSRTKAFRRFRQRYGDIFGYIIGSKR